MFKIFGHPDLPHQSVLVPVHTSQVADMREDILQTISQLESFNIS
jgi:hypothetical protein